MKTIKYLSMAALALVGAVTVGCSSDDNIIDEPQQPAKNVVTLTTTVSLDGGAQTRALTSGGVKTFAEGEQIALVYQNTSDETLKVESAALADGDITNEGKSATFTFELTDPDKAQNVTYIYPAAMAKADGSVNYDALASQDGTLATLSSSLDLATYSAAWDGTALPAATLANQLAILALTLKDAAGTNDITSTITDATLSDGTNSYAVTRSATAGPIYVAIQPTSSASIEVTATDGTTDYTKSLTGKTYAAGNGYSVSWRMTAPTTTPSLDLTSPAVGQVIGDDGKNYAYSSLPSGVTAVALICYVSGSNGLALALSDEDTMDWSTAITTAAAHTPAFTGGTWKLATKDEWDNMISAAGSYTALRDGFSSVGGTNMQSYSYWSSTEYNSERALAHDFDDGYWDRYPKGYDYLRVRACLAF